MGEPGTEWLIQCRALGSMSHRQAGPRLWTQIGDADAGRNVLPPRLRMTIAQMIGACYSMNTFSSLRSGLNRGRSPKNGCEISLQRVRSTPTVVSVIGFVRLSLS